MTTQEKEMRVGVRIGQKIRIINMNGEPQYSGKEGTVTYIDSALQIHGTWGGCALSREYGDSFIVTE